MGMREMGHYPSLQHRHIENRCLSRAAWLEGSVSFLSATRQFHFIFFIWAKVSLYGSVDQAGLEFRDLPASASWVQALSYYVVQVGLTLWILLSQLYNSSNYKHIPTMPHLLQAFLYIIYYFIVIGVMRVWRYQKSWNWTPQAGVSFYVD